LLTSAVNFSEGCNLDTVHRIAEAAAKYCYLLDVHVDPDHNRSVITLAGAPDTLVTGILAATATAVEAIDMSLHAGAHPRLGSIDVVPFVPFPTAADPAGSHFQIAVAASVSFAKQIWTQSEVPCFLYEMSSRGAPARCLSLPQIRREAFNTLEPDVGGPEPHPTAGGAVTGARRALVAYNLNLDIGDLRAARQIAVALRSGGREFWGITDRYGGTHGVQPVGPPEEKELHRQFVRALAIPMATRGFAQISCNLLRPMTVTMAHLFDAVSAMADRLGVEIINSELVGLAPKDALGGRSPQSLQLITAPKILEECMAAARG